MKTESKQKTAEIFLKCNEFFIKNNYHDKKLMTELVNDQLSYIDKIVYFKQLKIKTQVRDDLKQAAILGIYASVENYKLEKVKTNEVDFYIRTYLFSYVQHEFGKLVKFLMPKTRVAKKLRKYLAPISNKQITIEEVAKELNVSVFEIEALIQAEKNSISLEKPNEEDDSSEEIHPSKTVPQDILIDIKSLSEKMTEIYQKMGSEPKEKDILFLLAKNGNMKDNCFSSDSDEYPRSFADIGEKYGVSRERIRQISEKVKDQLKRELLRNNITKETLKMFEEARVFS